MARKRFTGGVNERGNRLGEWHHRAKLTDREVDEIRDLYEGGGFSYDDLATDYSVDKSTIYKIVKYKIRATTPARYRDYFKEIPS